MTGAHLRRAALVCAGIALLGEPVVAQQEQEQVDSAQIRIRERLRRLARPVGYDSVLFLQDSVRLAQAAEGVRPAGTAMDDMPRKDQRRLPSVS